MMSGLIVSEKRRSVVLAELNGGELGPMSSGREKTEQAGESGERRNIGEAEVLSPR
jgi:hypothetical protein